MRRPAGLSALIVVAALVVARPVAAEDDTEANRLFEQGRELFKAQDYEAACPLFEQSLALVPALGTELNLALCYAAIGRLVESRKLLDALAEKTVNKPGQEKRHALVVEAQEAIAKRVPTLAITLPGGVKRPRVDGVDVSVSVPIPVDPGEHVIDAQGAERKTVRVKEGEVLEVTLIATVVEQQPPPPPEPSRWRRRVPFVLAASGSAMVAGAVFTGVAVLGKKTEGLDRCTTVDGQLICDTEATKTLDSARTLSHVSTTLFVGGLALGGAAAWMYYKGWHRTGTTLTGWASSSSLGVAYGGAW